MGLDMYLLGDKFLFPPEYEYEDGYPIIRRELRLGYWRKHPNLHGYIVQTFARGKDDCQPLALTVDDLKQIRGAVEGDNLPHTEGFFFGVSDGSEKEKTLEILKNAIAWLQDRSEANIVRSVFYRASW